jgi:hypothetical protein
MISKYGGFYANDFQFDRTVKMTFISLFVVQIVLVAAMYAYYRWEQRTKSQIITSSEQLEEHADSKRPINESVLEFNQLIQQDDLFKLKSSIQNEDEIKDSYSSTSHRSYKRSSIYKTPDHF